MTKPKRRRCGHRNAMVMRDYCGISMNPRDDIPINVLWCADCGAIKHSWIDRQNWVRPGEYRMQTKLGKEMYAIVKDKL